MFTTKRTDSNDKDFQELVRALDAELKAIDGDDHAFYAQFNKLDKIKHAVVVYNQGVPVACGAVKEFASDTMEVKRMFVPKELRGQGIATIVLKALEDWCRELNYKKCVLETGKRQPDAVALYKKNGYQIIPNFGQYAGDENSVCFEKIL